MRSIVWRVLGLVAMVAAICVPAQALAFEADGPGRLTGGLTQAETLPAGVVPLLLSAIQRDAPAAYAVTRRASANSATPSA